MYFCYHIVVVTCIVDLYTGINQSIKYIQWFSASYCIKPEGKLLVQKGLTLLYSAF